MWTGQLKLTISMNSPLGRKIMSMANASQVTPMRLNLPFVLDNIVYDIPVRDEATLKADLRLVFPIIEELASEPIPIPMLLTCPACKHRHIDEGKFATQVHHTHSCQHCGTTWRPAVVATVGVRFLPGFKNGT